MTMPFVVLARELAFQKTDPERPTIPVGDEDIVPRGGIVPGYVPSFVVSALSAAGQIVWAEDRNTGLTPPDSQPPQVRSPEQPLVLPSDPNGVPPLFGDLVSSEPVAVDVEPAETPEATRRVAEPPKASDSKEVWESYAVTVGIPQAEAESMTKAALVESAKSRYRERSGQ
jgi:hypothetical protein